MAYGYGDGGGPTREMLENIEVMRDMPGLPQVRQSSVRAFFERLKPLAADRKMPVWNGELYLEYHRGTYTTQARVKRANRKAEFALHDAEFLACLARLLDPAYAYPAETFRRAWQLVCLNQFHDIIPGSSIGPVYEEALQQYAEVMQVSRSARDSALAGIAARTGGGWLLVNPTSFSRSEPVFLPGKFDSGFERDGQSLAVQPVEGGILVNPGSLPPYSVTPVEHSSILPAPRSPNLDELCLENEFLRVEFSAQGDITRIFDKSSNREVLADGCAGNQFQAFEDRPKDFDAWDIDIYYDDKMYLAEPASSISLVESGPLRWTMEVKRKILNSEITQRISLRHNSPRLDFDTTITWMERHTMLKAAFPVNVLSPVATYEIQWGNVERPTHKNTSWDWARFETCAHKWVDLSEGDYGVSLLNDCKYGHDVHDNVLRLTLLRSPTMPDPMADFGEHHFVYSLLPHAGSWKECVQREAYALNDPVIAYPCSEGSKKPMPPVSLVTCSAPNVVIETVKVAEDRDGIIVRLYESHRKRGPVTVRFAFEVQSAWVTNLLEENQSALIVESDSVHLELKPYQIATLRVKRGGKIPEA